MGSVSEEKGRERERTEVEDKVDSGPLLHHLETGTEDGATDVGGAVPERSAEADGPLRDPTVGRHAGELDLVVGDNLGELGLDVVRVNRLDRKYLG